MNAKVEISNYIAGRYNNSKLEKLKEKLDEKFNNFKPRTHQKFPEDGIFVQIGMSAKYQTPYIICEEWGEYLSVGEFEELIQEALEERGFEFSETEWDDDSFKITFD